MTPIFQDSSKISFSYLIYFLSCTMHIQTPLTALTLLSAAAGQPHPRRRCTSDDACWPTAQTWTEFNATVGGRLIRSVPSAAVCHGSRYNADQCATAKSNWLDGAWRSNQTGGYAATVWEMGETGKCFIDTPIQAECDQGIGMLRLILVNSSIDC